MGRSAPPRRIATAILLLALWLLAPFQAGSVEIEGVEFPDAIRTGRPSVPELRLHGVGLLRYRIVFRGYVAALYLPPGIPGDGALDDVSRRLELSYFWPIEGKDFGRAADRLLERKLSGPELERLRPRLEALHEAYRDVRPNDRYSLTYIPEVGTELRLNDELLATIPGADFAEAYFGIWLGREPLDAGLRDDLLHGR